MTVSSRLRTFRRDVEGAALHTHKGSGLLAPSLFSSLPSLFFSLPATLRSATLLSTFIRAPLHPPVGSTAGCCLWIHPIFRRPTSAQGPTPLPFFSLALFFFIFLSFYFLPSFASSFHSGGNTKGPPISPLDRRFPFPPPLLLLLVPPPFLFLTRYRMASLHEKQASPPPIPPPNYLLALFPLTSGRLTEKNNAAKCRPS
jgi:hypothetical protein